MELPSNDHPGWGRLLSAVLAEQPEVAGQADESTPAKQGDRQREAAEQAARRARTTVHPGSSDTYA